MGTPKSLDENYNEYIDRFVEQFKEDNIHKPSHYQIIPGIEVKHIRYALLGKIEPDISYNAIDYWSRSWEYLTRMWGKNGLEDAEKAYVYLGWLIEELKKDKKQ